MKRAESVRKDLDKKLSESPENKTFLPSGGPKKDDGKDGEAMKPAHQTLNHFGGCRF